MQQERSLRKSPTRAPYETQENLHTQEDNGFDEENQNQLPRKIYKEDNIVIKVESELRSPLECPPDDHRQ